MASKIRSDLLEWKALEEHAKSLDNFNILNFFDNNPDRFDDFSIRMDHLLLDYSKQRLNADTVQKLCEYAKACDLEDWRGKMFSGEAINITEDRAVLHTALRAKSDGELKINDADIYPEIQKTLNTMKNFADNIRKNKTYTDVVNIGIGGSDLGAVMAYEALKPFTDRDINFHFVSNVDATHLAETLRVITPETTLFIVTSKTFTTQETMTNAASARAWLQDKLGKDDISDHFVAVSQNIEGASDFGIEKENIFPIWDWVGGRYSIWSAVGLPLCIALGGKQFQEFLDGARTMDDHFKTAPMEDNVPIMLALVGLWNRNFLKYDSLAVIPYDQYLHRFPAFLQQLDMESNGKAVDRDNNQVPYDTGPTVFGESGTNSQHAFFQLIHQGTNIIPCEFIAAIKSQNPIGDHQKMLLANVIAQSKALMEGKEDSDPHKMFQGNRPSTTILLDELTPYTLGMLIALYEHKVFVQGVLWNINSFDQCGVELGKVLARQIMDTLDGNGSDTDSSTQNLIDMIKD